MVDSNNKSTDLHNSNTPRFLTIRQFAALGILPENTIRRLVKAGKVPGFYSGNWYLINVEKFIELLDQ